MIGIYKITSPSGKVYIGQSVNVERRLQEYGTNSINKQHKIKNSIIKYGLENHTLEVIEECLVEELNDKEAYWQDFYDCVRNGLNCRRTKSIDSSGYMCDDTKRKISESRKANPNVNEKRKGVPLTEEHKLKIGNGNRGKKHSLETLEKISKNRKGKMTGETHHNYGKGLNEKSRKAFSEIRKNATGLDNLESKVVIDLNTGIYYYSIKEAILYNKNLSYMKLLGNHRNNTSLVVAEDYEKNNIKIFIEKKNLRNSRKITDGTSEYNSISEYARIKNTTTDKVYTKIKNKEIKYV